MVFQEYETVLKQLDRWANEAKAVAKTVWDLEDKVEFLRFHDSLREARVKLRRHIFTAEDVSKYDFTTEQEDVLVAHLREK